MLLRARPHPRAEHWARGVSGGSGYEFMSALTKSTISTKSDGLEADVQALFLNNLVRAAFLVEWLAWDGDATLLAGLDRVEALAAARPPGCEVSSLEGRL